MGRGRRREPIVDTAKTEDGVETLKLFCFGGREEWREGAEDGGAV